MHHRVCGQVIAMAPIVTTEFAALDSALKRDPGGALRAGCARQQLAYGPSRHIVATQNNVRHDGNCPIERRSEHLSSDGRERHHKSLHPLIIPVLSLDEEWIARRGCRSVRDLFISEDCIPQPINQMMSQSFVLSSVSPDPLRHFEITASRLLRLGNRNWTNAPLAEGERLIEQERYRELLRR